MEDKKTNPTAQICTCIQDPFVNLPPELRQKPVQKMGGLRKVTCPNCGLSYWTTRETDLCVECEKKELRSPKG